MTARTVGGEANTALMKAWNTRQRERANCRTVASLIRRRRLLWRAALFASRCDLEVMTSLYPKTME